MSLFFGCSQNVIIRVKPEISQGNPLPPQVLDPQYGMYVWPCAVVLAQYLWSRREQLSGLTVLEVRHFYLPAFEPV